MATKVQVFSDSVAQVWQSRLSMTHDVDGENREMMDYRN